MKNLLLIAFCSLPFLLSAQVKTKLYVGGPLATNVYRGPLGSDSALYIGSGCGDPNTLIPKANVGQFYNVYRGAIIFKDTCANSIWTTNPDSSWTQLLGGDTSITYIAGDTVIVNNFITRKALKIPLTDTTHAKKGCGNIIYDTINEHYYGDVCLNGAHDQWACFDCAGGGSNITLQTNGVNNGDQTLLNLQQGNGVVIADNGTGTVTISTTSLEIDTTFTLDGTVLILTVPHGLGSTPDFIEVRVDNEQGLSTFVQPYADNTNIYIPYSIGPICTCAYQIRIRP